MLTDPQQGQILASMHWNDYVTPEGIALVLDIPLDQVKTLLRVLETRKMVMNKSGTDLYKKRPIA